jgi:hypothetical protein
MPNPDIRWMPPSPHRERILEEIANGSAHIVERGHGVPPLLVFEDGGMIELSRVRLAETRRGPQLVGSDEPATRGESRFYDVCGTVDEILGKVHEGRPLNQEEIGALLSDILYMLDRMARRGEQYRAFFARVQAVAETALADVPPPAWEAAGRVQAFGDALGMEGSQGALETAEVVARGEHARSLAQDTEDYISRCKSAAMQVCRLYADVKGGRAWDDTTVATEPAADRSGSQCTYCVNESDAHSSAPNT